MTTPFSLSTDQPSYRNAASTAQLVAWDLIDDVLKGTANLRAKASVYLPQFPLETADLWRQRIMRTELYNGFSATVHGLTGLAFRKPPKLDEKTPQILVDHAEDIDLKGTHFEVFARELFEDGMAHGHVGILVDYPTVEEEYVSKADEKARGLRPYWCPITARSINNWRVDRINGKVVFTLLVLEENVVEPRGDFGEQQVTRYRVFRRQDNGVGIYEVVWQLWETTTPAGANVASYKMVSDGVVTRAGGKPFSAIPFVPYYAGRKLDVLVSQPPLEDLAYTNVAHFQVLADHRTSGHYASVPILVRVGADSQSTTQAVGGPVGIDVPEGGNAFYVQGASESRSETREDLKDIEGRMASQGLALLSRETRAAETAEAKRIDAGEQHSRLAVAVRGLQDALEQAFVFHAEYLGIDAPSVAVNIDFEGLAMDPAMVAQLLSMRAQRDLSQETLWELLKTGKVLPDEFDPKAEKVRLEDEAPAAGDVPLPGEDPNAPPTNPGDPKPKPGDPQPPAKA